MKRSLCAALAGALYLSLGLSSQAKPAMTPPSVPLNTEAEASSEDRLRVELLNPQRSRSLSRMEALQGAWKSNLRLKAARFDPEKEKAVKLSEEAIFDPMLRASLARFRLNQLVGTGLTSVLQGQEGTSFNTELEHLTGEGVRYGLTYRNSLDRYLFAELGVPSLSSQGSVFVTLTVPILKGQGSAVTNGAIHKAQKRYEAAVAAVEEQSIQVGGEVLTAYFNLVLARMVLNTRIRSLTDIKLLTGILEQSVEAGRSAPFELLEARQHILQREADIDDGVKQIAFAEHALVRLMGQESDDTRLIPSDDSDLIPNWGDYNLTQLQETGLIHRPLVAQAVAARGEAEIEVVRRENMAQPQLDFFTDYRVTQGTGSGNNWQLGLQFSSPLGNREAEGQLKKAQLDVEQAQVRIDDAKQRVRSEVSQAWAEVGIQKRRHERSHQAALLAHQFSLAERERFNAGYTASNRAIFAEQQEVNALEFEARTLIDYQLAQASLLRALGFCLPARNELEEPGMPHQGE